jgi:hypothetical protein
VWERAKCHHLVGEQEQTDVEEAQRPSRADDINRGGYFVVDYDSDSD